MILGGAIQILLTLPQKGFLTTNFKEQSYSKVKYYKNMMQRLGIWLADIKWNLLWKTSDQGPQAGLSSNSQKMSVNGSIQTQTATPYQLIGLGGT